MIDNIKWKLMDDDADILLWGDLLKDAYNQYKNNPEQLADCKTGEARYPSGTIGGFYIAQVSSYENDNHQKLYVDFVIATNSYIEKVGAYTIDTFNGYIAEYEKCKYKSENAKLVAEGLAEDLRFEHLILPRHQ